MSNQFRYTRQPSYWEATHWPSEVEVAVVGGGIVGLQSAIQLATQRPEWKIAVIERSDPPAGASTRNAGFACIGSLTELAEDITDIGFDATIDLVKRRLAGLHLLRDTLSDKALAYEGCGNIEWFRTEDQDSFQRALNLLPKVNAALQEALSIAESVFSNDTVYLQSTKLSGLGAIRNSLEGQLDPGKMMRGLQAKAAALGVQYIHSDVAGIEGSAPDYHLELRGRHPLRTKQVVLATNAFTAALAETQIRPALNQVIVSSPIKHLAWTLPMHLDRGYGYIRRIGNRVLVGGFRHLVGASAKTSQFGLDARLGAHLRGVLQEVLPKGYRIDATEHSENESVRIEYEWSGVLGLGPNRNPRAIRDKHGIIHAAGLGGMGIALGSLLGREAAQLVLDEV